MTLCETFAQRLKLDFARKNTIGSVSQPCIGFAKDGYFLLYCKPEDPFPLEGSLQPPKGVAAHPTSFIVFYKGSETSWVQALRDLARWVTHIEHLSLRTTRDTATGIYSLDVLRTTYEEEFCSVGNVEVKASPWGTSLVFIDGKPFDFSGLDPLAIRIREALQGEVGNPMNNATLKRMQAKIQKVLGETTYPYKKLK